MKQKKNWYRPLVQCLQGIVVGAGGILPGLSGGVLCVIFGLYAPMMELLAHPFRTWKKHIKWIVPFGLGIALGFFGVARVLEILLSKNATLVTCVFIGLILGTLPDLFAEGRKEGWSRRATTVLLVALLLLTGFFVSVQFLHVSLQMNLAWAFFCGLLWGVRMISVSQMFAKRKSSISSMESSHRCMAKLQMTVSYFLSSSPPSTISLKLSGRQILPVFFL
jgi:putative membrane protein